MKTTTSKMVLTSLLAGTAAILAVPALAQFPEKPITMYIGFGPGGAVDTTARLLMQNLEEELGVPVVAAQQLGGGGSVMAATMMNQPADGNTIGMGASAAGSKGAAARGS